jgi:hypothetical protein
LILIHPEAVVEARNARRRYARLDPVVGHRFAVAYDDVIDRIAQSPDRWPAYPHARGDYRWCRFHRFPFAGIYEVFPQVVHVLAIAADRREPGYWVARK